MLWHRAPGAEGIGRRAVIFRLELAAGDQPFHARSDGGEDLRHVLVARWGRGVKGELPWPSFAEDAVQHQRMEVDIQLEAAPEALDHRHRAGLALRDAVWAAIERPEGRGVDFLLDHGVLVYPVNPKALDRARDRFRQSEAKSDPFDARMLADFLRTDHAHLHALQPSSEAAQELKLLTDDYQRRIRQQTRLVNQLTATLKAYYPRALEIAELTTTLAREFLQAYPTPEAVVALTERRWQRWARAHRLSEARTRELWDILQRPQLPVPAHVVRANAQLTRGRS